MGLDDLGGNFENDYAAKLYWGKLKVNHGHPPRHFPFLYEFLSAMAMLQPKDQSSSSECVSMVLPLDGQVAVALLLHFQFFFDLR